MSGIMKIFFDRISDLLYHHNDLARQMENKKMFLLSCGSNENFDDCFVEPFRLSAGYLKMKFVAHCHGWTKDHSVPAKVRENLNSLIDQLK